MDVAVQLVALPAPRHKATGSIKLRGKASEVRWFNFVAEKLWKKHYNPKLAIHRTVLACLSASVKMENVLNEYPDMYALPGKCFLLN